MPKGSANASKTHCPQGHEYTLTYGRANGPKTRVCRTCRNDQQTAYVLRRAMHSTPGKSAKSRMASWVSSLKRKFGMTLADYESLLSVVPGCAICGKTPAENRKRLAVDHCHKTGRVRGLLCNNCNSGIGSLRDGEHFKAALAYLSP